MNNVITTQSGSMYQVDEDNKRVRRLVGNGSPTIRIGKDGDWRSYQEITNPKVGECLIIVWSSDVPLLIGNEPGVPLTRTSVVVSIENVN